VIHNIAKGVHLLSLASDAFAWRTEVHHDSLGNTLIEVDKSGPDANDPANGDESGKWLFRNLTDERGQRMGEEAITFARYFAYVGPKTPYPLTISPRRAVDGPEDPTLLQHWLFAGTNLVVGERIPDVLAGDLDAINPASNLPAHKDLVIVHSEVDWGHDPPVVPNDMVLLERPSGQLTFHTGTWYLAKVMMSNAPAAPKLRRLVSNVLGRMLGTPYDLPH
ncbi:MAG TPA: N,N-dimethylformamidase beta subunit family domain-containing protein, partial [Mycobacterium sp.]|nr:N,N-dimethylformamidase beta subunit family domain-containing protein [Mycobacterium sp.]